jgi:hypothetical protein
MGGFRPLFGESRVKEVADHLINSLTNLTECTCRRLALHVSRFGLKSFGCGQSYGFLDTRWQSLHLKDLKHRISILAVCY